MNFLFSNDAPFSFALEVYVILENGAMKMQTSNRPTSMFFLTIVKNFVNIEA